MIVEVVTRIGYAFKHIKEGYSAKESIPFSMNREKHPKLATMLFIGHAFDREDKSVLLKEKSELRKIRMKAFFTSRKKVPIGYSTQQLVGK